MLDVHHFWRNQIFMSNPSAPVPAPAPEAQPLLKDFFSAEEVAEGSMFSLIFGGTDGRSRRFVLPYAIIERAEYWREEGFIDIWAGERLLRIKCQKRLQQLVTRKGQSPDDLLDALETNKLVSIFEEEESGIEIKVLVIPH